MRRLRERKEWKLFAALAKADPALAGVWWVALVLRGLLPALFGIAMGVLVAAVQRGGGLAAPLTFAGIVFVLLQVLAPVHQAVSANLGDRTAAWLYDRLAAACVQPPGMGHLEDPKLTNDLTVARDFDLGMTAPPLSISMDFIAGSLVEMIAGLAFTAVLAGYRWWAALVLGGAWLTTHWLLRESAVWHDRNTEAVRAAQRDAEYAYRLAVDPPAAKELRLFGLAGWVIDRFLDVTFAYPQGGSAPVLAGFDLTIPAGSSLAIVGQNGAGKTTLAKLLCRLYDPQAGSIEVDGVDLRDFALDSWRERITAVFQDFIRFELPLRDNVALPKGSAAPPLDAAVLAALEEAGAAHLAGLDTVLARGYEGGTDLSGGQWQRVALARALYAVRLGAGV